RKNNHSSGFCLITVLFIIYSSQQSYIGDLLNLPIRDKGL
ncbi:MAG: sporulation protein YjcZ, partial [Lachnospiraceae bacterium]|nr:sporulation protein YjcZ [Lachnospiraceae bacterium]